VALVYVRHRAAKTVLSGSKCGYEDVGVWTHCVGSEYDAVVGCNEASCSMKGGESEFLKQDCAQFICFTPNSNADVGVCYRMHVCHVLCVWLGLASIGLVKHCCGYFFIVCGFKS
jgi:hypothetical protein